MHDDFICTECGGVIGAAAGTDEGRPCTCGAPGNGSDTAVIASPVKKVCCICGIDLVHKKRLRDDKGYWCVHCHKADRSSRKAGAGNSGLNVPCTECGKGVPMEKLIAHEGSRLCPDCYHTRLNFAKKSSRRRFTQSGRAQHNRAKVMQQLAIVFAVALLLGALWWLHLLPTQRAKPHTATSGGNDAITLVKNARIVGVMFLCLILMFVWWVRRQF